MDSTAVLFLLYIYFDSYFSYSSLSSYLFKLNTIYWIRFVPFRSSDVSIHNQLKVRPNNCSNTNSIPCSDTKNPSACQITEFASTVSHAQPFHFSGSQRPTETLCHWPVRRRKSSSAETHLIVAARSRVALQALNKDDRKGAFRDVTHLGKAFFAFSGSCTASWVFVYVCEKSKVLPPIRVSGNSKTLCRIVGRSHIPTSARSTKEHGKCR